MVDIQIINPISYPGWDEILLSSANYSFFYSSFWAKVLFESYGYTPKYFTLLNGKKLSALLPVMEINSFLTGRRAVSLPFTDYCDPMVYDGLPFLDFLTQLFDYGKSCGWKFIELRGGQNHLPFARVSASYLGHILDLSQDEEKIFSSFRESTKRNIKKALKEGVKVTISNSLESLKEFYRLNCITRKHHGLPPQPYTFFEKVYDQVINKKLGFVVLASWKEKAVAGAVYLHFGEKAVYKYGASDMNYQNLRANNLVMWEAIKWYSQNGYKSFCFGRTEPENQGLIQFKTGWGTSQHQINYYRYDLRKEAFVVGSPNVTGFHNKIFSKIPIPILNRIGNILYRHMG